MKWDKYTIATTTAAEDIISAMLGELGIEGIDRKSTRLNSSHIH